LRLLFASYSETLLCYGLPAPAGTLSFILSILMIQSMGFPRKSGDKEKTRYT
jgi:hypothetical protein